MAKKKYEKSVRLTVEAELLQAEGRERPEAVAYAFSQGGRLLASEPLEGDRATLSLPARPSAQQVRLVVGPKMEQAPALAELRRRGGEERLLRVDPDVFEHLVRVPVLDANWLCWLASVCFVRGTLIKKTTLGGLPAELPICDADVEIFEVDAFPKLVFRLADEQIEDVRRVLLGRSPRMIPPERLEPLAAPSSEGQPAFAADSNMQLLARTANTDQLRAALAELPLAIRPLLCLYIPHTLSLQKVGEARTDECGRFRTFFFRGCNNPDTPDLYFRAKQKLFGFFEITIYNPTPIYCYTHWNYACGTEVTLTSTHPFAKTCAPCQDVDADPNWVLVRAIGNTPLSRIRGTSKLLAATTAADEVGLHYHTVQEFDNQQNTFAGRPFGALLRPRIEFDNALREDLGVRYYRVSWRRGTAGDFQPLDGEVHRHYTHDAGGSPVDEVFPLGPQVVGGTPCLFEIPPPLPPLGQWGFPDAVEDLTSAKFPTQMESIAPGVPNDEPDESGKLQLKIELFDENGALVDVDNAGPGGGETIRYWVPQPADVSVPGTLQTVPADDPDLDLVKVALGDASKSFIMTVHVDNNRCSAAIGAPSIGGTGANDCGVLAYDDPAEVVDLPFTALHRNGFARYSFNLRRGIFNVLSDSGDATPPGSFSASDSVGDLLTESCPIAGFSEHLHVDALATDGWGVLNAYDANDHRGFALAPESVVNPSP